LAAGPRGAVYAVYEGKTRSGGLEIDALSSHDHGLTFGRPVVLGTVPGAIRAGPNLPLSTGPAVATNQHSGAVYVAYATHLHGAASSDIVVARSFDGGRTWTTARATHEGPTPSDYFFQPQLTVDSAGVVDVSFFALHGGRVYVFLARSVHSAYLGFGPDQLVTSRSFNPALGIAGTKRGLWWIGDYQGLAAAGTIHPIWNDTRTGGLEIFSASLPARSGG
jgi:hypothetical protein